MGVDAQGSFTRHPNHRHTVMTQHEFIEAIYAYYKEYDIQPGDPNEGRWEAAHYPTPKWAGGTETVLLLHEHHQEQGLRQSVEFGRACFFSADTKAWLNERYPDGQGELWDIYREIGSAFRGRQHTEDARRRMGRPGVKLTEEHRRRIGEGQLGMIRGPLSEETKKKISRANQGNHHTDEFKQHLSKVMTGRRRTEAQRENYRVASQRRAADPNWINKLKEVSVTRNTYISTLTGMVSVSGNIARHNRSRGGDGSERVRVPEALRSIVQKSKDPEQMALNLESYECWLSLHGEEA